MVEKVRIPFEKRKETMEQIKNITIELRKAVESMEAPPTIIKAYLNSVTNLETKNQKYGEEKERFHLSEEEREIIENIRNGKAKVTSVKRKED